MTNILLIIFANISPPPPGLEFFSTVSIGMERNLESKNGILCSIREKIIEHLYLTLPWLKRILLNSYFW